MSRQITVAETRKLFEVTQAIGAYLTNAEMLEVMSVYMSAIKRLEQEEAPHD